MRISAADKESESRLNVCLLLVFIVSEEGSIVHGIILSCLRIDAYSKLNKQEIKSYIFLYHENVNLVKILI